MYEMNELYIQLKWKYMNLIMCGWQSAYSVLQLGFIDVYVIILTA